MKVAANRQIQTSTRGPHRGSQIQSTAGVPDLAEADSAGHLQNRVMSAGGGDRQVEPRHARLSLKKTIKSAAEEKDSMLDIVNKVEMFRIATEKINTQLQFQKKPPIFNLSGAPNK